MNTAPGKSIRRILLILLAPSFLFIPAATAKEQSLDQIVYVIPVEGMIEPALVYVIRRGIQEASDADAAALVISMDTLGGRLDATEEIVELLNRVKIPTYTFVRKNAISAGAIISLATDQIYMAPGSKIGDAMPVVASPTGEMQPQPDAEREKITSFADALIRSIAEQHGYDKQLASKMVRREGEFKVDDKVICPEGQILTLTNKEAEQPVGKDKRPLLSRGTVDSLSDMLARAGLVNPRLVELEVTRAEEIARFIAGMAPLFLAAGLLGLYMEMKAPGLGLPGILGLISLAIFFWGHHIAGLAGMEEVVVLIIGLILILVELLYFPGHGSLALLGLCLVIGALLGAMIESLPGDPVIPSWPTLEIPVYKLSASFLMTLIGAAVLARFLPQSPLARPMILQEAGSRAKGYTASRDTQDLLGRSGTAMSDLRPAGVVQIGDAQLDVVTRGEFVPHGARIKVVETHGNRIIVESVSG